MTTNDSPWFVTAALLCLFLGVNSARAEPPASRAEAQALIADARHIVTPDGIEELKAIQIGGIQQWISVRGKNKHNPVLLFVHGGPASPEMPSSWFYQTPWEEYFTVVQWDQRGAGKTYLANDPAKTGPTIGIERMIQDGEEVVAYLQKTYAQKKIFVLAHSWGTVIGLSLAKRHPDWLHAYVGMGQFIDGQRNERVSYDFASSSAKASGNAQAQSELKAIAPYPRADGTVSVEQIGTERKWAIYYGGLSWQRHDFGFTENLALLSPDYVDKDLGASEGVLDTFVQLLPELATTNFFSVTTLSCPVFIFAGKYDFETPSEIAVEWFGKLKAPHKELVHFDRSSHEMQMDEPGKLLLTLVTRVRPLATGAEDPSGDGDDDGEADDDSSASDTGDMTRDKGGCAVVGSQSSPFALFSTLALGLTLATRRRKRALDA